MNQTILKHRLLLKRLSIRVLIEVKENFGYAPSNENFNDILDKRNCSYSYLKERDKEWLLRYKECEYSENFSNLTSFV